MNNRLMRTADEVRKSRQNIPEAFLKPIIESKWKTGEYDLNKFEHILSSHQVSDNQGGSACYYIISSADPAEGMLKRSELAPMINSGRIPTNFYSSNEDGAICINEHYMHSMEQFYAHVQKAWDAHLERTDRLVGKPSGRIHAVNNSIKS